MRGITVKIALFSVLAIVLLFGCDLHSAEKDRPSAPTGVEVSANSPTSVTIKWNKVDKADYYSVDYAEGSKTASKKFAGDNITKLEYTYNGLEEGKIYYFFVRAHNKNGPSGYSDPVSITLVKLDTPTGIVAQAKSTDTIALSWNRVHGAQNYSIFRTANSPSGAQALIKTVADRTYDDKELEPNKTYYYFIEANSSDGSHSDISSPVGATTKGGAGSTRETAIPLIRRSDLYTLTPGSFPLGQHEVWYKTEKLTGMSYLYGDDRYNNSFFTADIVGDLYLIDGQPIDKDADLGGDGDTESYYEVDPLMECYFCIRPKHNAEENKGTFGLYYIDYDAYDPDL